MMDTLKSTMVVELAASGAWVAHGEYLNVGYMVTDSTRYSTVVKAAEVREAIYDKWINGGCNYFQKLLDNATAPS